MLKCVARFLAFIFHKISFLTYLPVFIFLAFGGYVYFMVFSDSQKTHSASHQIQASVPEPSFDDQVQKPLTLFLQRKEEKTFMGVDHISIYYVRFSSPRHNKVVLMIPGRTETALKYTEVAYDFFQKGYDVLILDHLGQGRSGRILPDPQRGHVTHFEDYVDDVALLIKTEINSSRYQHRYALAHSMGGPILVRYMAKNPATFDAVALTSPMFGIRLPLNALFMDAFLNLTERIKMFREYYALGQGPWKQEPYENNKLTYSQKRYQHFVQQYAQSPELQSGGPIYHWLYESINVGKKMRFDAKKIKTPLLLLQASEDERVENASHITFFEAMPRGSHEMEIIQGAKHEILFEQDPSRSRALDLISAFFLRHSSSSLPHPS